MIREHQAVLTIPTNSEELASLLEIYSYDWLPVLDFFCSLAKAKGIIINKQEVIGIMNEMNGVD